MIVYFNVRRQDDGLDKSVLFNYKYKHHYRHQQHQRLNESSSSNLKAAV